MKFVLGILLIFGLIGQTAEAGDIPKGIVDWSMANVWKIHVPMGRGSGFWLNKTTFITACHTVGAGYARAINHDKTEYAFLAVQSCNEKTDIAVLIPSKDFNYKPMPTYLGLGTLAFGREVYTAGYSLGWHFQIRPGHVQAVDPDGYGPIISAFAIDGNSGGPVLIWDGTKVLVVGIVAAIYRAPIGTTYNKQGEFVERLFDNITSMVVIAPASSIVRALHEKD